MKPGMFAVGARVALRCLITAGLELPRPEKICP